MEVAEKLEVKSLLCVNEKVVIEDLIKREEEEEELTAEVMTRMRKEEEKAEHEMRRGFKRRWGAAMGSSACVVQN